MNWNIADLHASYGKFEQLPPISEKAEIAFSGRSNVGKSSLINKLLNRKSLARVSSTPGKTITLNFYNIGNIDKEIYIVDLPGYGYAKTSKDEKARFGKLTEQYIKSGRISLLVQLIDFRHPPTADDLIMIEFLKETGIPFVIALTKADKLKKTKRLERSSAFKTQFPEINIIEFSSETGEGVDELRQVIENYG
ncbi:MAG: ribosome biogenesis GTP-binding protein YihA/YsxC [Oscillospiraceae bacterium]|nr:ribosome biogenesis GTP-binding protein YihA/YsxC [Oscillospiraceae bacterium]